MKKYRVVYISSTDDDCYSVPVYANSHQEAIEETKREYWDCKEVIDCYVLSLRHVIRI